MNKIRRKPVRIERIITSLSLQNLPLPKIYHIGRKTNIASI